jgi:predicted membrane-bound spermidine synthase
MTGIAFGSFCITHRLDRMKKDSLLFLKTEAWIILYSILLPFVFSIPSQYIENKVIDFLLYSTFLLMSFLSGMFIGLQFPLAAKIYMSFHKEKKSLGQTAGWLYGADLFGGFFGGLLGGVLFFPVLGLKNTCFMMAMIKGSSAFLFLLFMKTQRAR